MRRWPVWPILCIGVLGSSGALGGQANDPSVCLPDVATQRVLSLELPGGAERRVEKFGLALSLPAARRALAVSLQRVAVPGHLMRQQVGQWQTFSFWLRQRFCVIQVRAAGSVQTEGLLTLTDYGTGRSGVSAVAFLPPPWWPRLRASRVERWLDGGRRVTTITGFSTQGLAAVHEQITRAAARGGLVPSAQMQAPLSAPGRQQISRNGLMLIFRGADRELAVTLTAVSGLSSVVAHLEEY